MAAVDEDATVLGVAVHSQGIADGVDGKTVLGSQTFVANPNSASSSAVTAPFSTPSARDDDAWIPADLTYLYEMRRLLGKGGMGAVHEVFHKRWKRSMAVKSPLADRFRSQEEKDAFIKECESWVNLGLHPHIVCAYMVREISGTPRVFVEVVDEGDLTGWITSKRLYEGDARTVQKRMLDCAIQVAWGLEYAHSRGLVHQDMKCDNVMAKSTGKGDVLFKITDFGLCTPPVKSDSAKNNNQHGTAAAIAPFAGGTMAYWSPEQADTYKLLSTKEFTDESSYLDFISALDPMTHKCDIYSYGVTMLQLLIGKRTWNRGNLGTPLMDEIQKRESHVPSIPELEAVVSSCLAVNPTDRPADMNEVANSLIAVYKTLTGSAYNRKKPKSAAEEAYSLNNRALWYMDMNRREEAYSLWKQAIKNNSQHVHSVYNFSVQQWIDGELTDIQALAKVQSLSQTAEVKRLIALIQMRRGEFETAESILNSIQNSASDTIRPEIENALLAVTNASKEVKALPEKKQIVGTAEQTCLDAFVITPNHRFIVAATRTDKLIRVYRNETGFPLVSTLKGHTSSVNQMQCTPDGRYVLSADEHNIRVWDTENWTQKALLKGGCSSLGASLLITPNSRYAVVHYNVFDERQDYVMLFDLQTFTLKAKEKTACLCMCLLPDNRIAIISNSYPIEIRQLDTLKLLHSFKATFMMPGTVSAECCVIEDGRYIVVSQQSRLDLLDSTTYAVVRTIQGSTTATSGTLLVTADSKYALTALSDGWGVWDLVNGKYLRSVHTAHWNSWNARWYYDSDNAMVAVNRQLDNHSYAPGIEFSPSPTLPVFRSLEDWCRPDQLSDLTEIVADDASSRESQYMQKIDRALASLQSYRQSNDPRPLLEALTVVREARSMAGMEGRKEGADLWAQLSMDCIKSKLNDMSNLSSVVSEDGTGWTGVRLIPNSNKAIVQPGSMPMVLDILDLDSRTIISQIQLQNMCSKFAVSPDGAILVVVSFGVILLIDMNTHETLNTIETPDFIMLSGVEVTPDGKTAVVMTLDATMNICYLLLVDLPTRTLRKTIKGSSIHTGAKGAGGLALSKDGKFAFTSCWDGKVGIWSLEKGTPLKSILLPIYSKETGGCIPFVAVTPDSRYVISSSYYDKLTRVYQMGTWQEVAQIKFNSANCCAITADSRFIMCTTLTGEMEVADLTSMQVVKTVKMDMQATPLTTIVFDDRRSLLILPTTRIEFTSMDWELEDPVVPAGSTSSEQVGEVGEAKNSPELPKEAERLQKEKELADAKLKAEEEQAKEAERLQKEKELADAKLKAEESQAKEAERLQKEKELADAKLTAEEEQAKEAERLQKEKELADAKLTAEEEQAKDAERLQKEKELADAKLKAEEEQAKEAERQRLEEEEAIERDKAENAARQQRAEEERKRLEEEEKLEQIRLETQRQLREQQQEEERQRQKDAEELRKAEQEKKRLADIERARALEEERRRLDEAKRREEHERLRKEEEERLRQEEERRALEAALEAKRQEEVRLKQEADQRRKQLLVEQRKQEMEARRRMEERLLARSEAEIQKKKMLFEQMEQERERSKSVSPRKQTRAKSVARKLVSKYEEAERTYTREGGRLSFDTTDRTAFTPKTLIGNWYENRQSPEFKRATKYQIKHSPHFVSMPESLTSTEVTRVDAVQDDAPNGFLTTYRAAFSPPSSPTKIPALPPIVPPPKWLIDYRTKFTKGHATFPRSYMGAQFPNHEV